MALDAKHVFTAAMVCATALACAHLVAQAGDLTPPGAPGPTMKTLDEVEARIPIGPLTTPGDADSVYKITQPGSYYLTERLASAPNRHGIEIASANVTVDLNGYSLAGLANSLNAIEVTAVINVGIEVRNGNLESWGTGGVNAPTIVGMRITDVDAVLITGGAAFVVGPNATISECTALFGGAGFVAGKNSVIDRCVAEGSIGLGDGFVVGPGTVVSRSIASNNGGHGFDSIDPESIGGNVFVACIARGNGNVGIKPGITATVQDCTASGNGVGMSAGNGSVIIGCVTAENTGDGISGIELLVDSCVSRRNGVRGFVFGSRSIITRSHATGNEFGGIEAGFGSVIDSCLVSASGGSGITFAEDSVVTNNTVIDNNTTMAGGGGITTIWNGSRIEGNYAAGNNFGFEITGTGNTLIGNQARNNANNYGQVVAGNHVGTIVVNAAGMNGAANDKVNLAF